jgi:Acyl-CoA thioester hydrolase/BAAT N-terminal region
MPCDPEKRSVLLPTAVQRIDLVVQIADAHLHKVMGDRPMDLQLSGFAPEQFVMVQTASPPGEGVWKAQAPFLTDNYGCVAIATQAPLAGDDRDMDALGHFWSPFQNRGDLNYRETQQFAPGLEWAPCTPRVLSKTPPGENCTQRDELPNICYTGSVPALSNRDAIKEQNHVEADPSADRERRTWRRRNSQRA